MDARATHVTSTAPEAARAMDALGAHVCAFGAELEVRVK